MDKIVDVETVQELSHPDYSVNGVKQDIHNTQLQPRALSELVDAGVISDAEHDGFEIEYATEQSSDTIATSTYAVTEGVAYLSWIWVAKPFRGNGIGTRLTEQTITSIQQHDVHAIYTLPKSKAAESIFDKFEFASTDEINGKWKVRKIE